MRVFETKHPTGLRVEAANELAVVGEARPNDLNRNVALGLRFQRAMHEAQRTRTDLLDQAITTQRLAAEVEAWVLIQDSLLELLHDWRWVEAQLVAQHDPQPLIGAQRVGLPPGAVERDHQLRDQALAQGVPSDEALELRHQLGVPADRKLCVGQILLRAQPQL